MITNLQSQAIAKCEEALRAAKEAGADLAGYLLECALHELKESTCADEPETGDPLNSFPNRRLTER
jgi:hypothetical protein